MLAAALDGASGVVIINVALHCCDMVGRQVHAQKPCVIQVVTASHHRCVQVNLLDKAKKDGFDTYTVVKTAKLADAT